MSAHGEIICTLKKLSNKQRYTNRILFDIKIAPLDEFIKLYESWLKRTID